MTINSLAYLAFLAGVYLVYFLAPKKYQWIVLLIASYSFYIIAGITPFIFVVATTCIAFFSARRMEKVKQEAANKKEGKTKNKPWLVCTMVLIFGVLFMLKYYNSVAEGLNDIFTTFQWSAKAPLVNIILPMGISFYMFQSVGYLIDVYRGTIEAEKNFWHFALFTSFFPQAVQGPISRYNQLAPQLMAERPFDYDKFCRGAQLMIWGFFKKMVIADRLAIGVEYVFDNYGTIEFNGLQTFVAIFFYAIQIYADFSGGIDIIRGAAESMGIDMVENFERPYFGNTVAAYWRRWHMSLTNWMRDYVFYSLALSKLSNKIGKWGRKTFKGYVGKQMPTFLPTFTTFFLIGIWHGAGWGFIVFGFYNAIIIVASQMMQPIWDGLNKKLHINTESKLWLVWQVVRTFTLMAIGKCITRAMTVKQGFAMLATGWKIFGDGYLKSLIEINMSYGDLAMAVISMLVLFCASLIQERGIVIRDKLATSHIAFRWAVLIIGILSVVVFGVYGPGYNASSFIYNGF